MKKALLKNTIREIKNTKARFISILMIVALGVGFFVGVKSASPSMEKMAIDYYKDTNLMDVKLLSTVGFDDDDVQKISATNGIKDVMPSYFLDVSVTYQNVGRIFRLHAVPSEYEQNESISDLQVVEGRLPQKSGEIAVEKTDIRPYKIGDKIKIDSKVGDVDVESNLDTLEYTVVGIVRSPMYISLDRGTTNVGNGKIDGFAYISPQCFDIERYTVVYATLDTNEKDVSPFDEQYDKMIDDVIDDLELTADERVVYFNKENIEKAQKEIDDGKVELDDARKKADKELKDAQAEIEKGEKEYYSGINQAQTQINNGQSQMNSSRAELDVQWATYNESVEKFNTEINLAKEELNKGKAEYESALSEIDALKNTANELKAQKVSVATQTLYGIISSLPQGTDQSVIDTLKFYASNITADNAKDVLVGVKSATFSMFDGALDTAISAIDTIDSNLIAIESGIAMGEQQLLGVKEQLDFAEAEIAQKEAMTLEQLSQYKSQLDNAESELQNANIQLQNSRIELDKAKTSGLLELEKGKSEFEKAKADAEKELDDAQTELDDAQKKLDDLGEVKWYVFDRTDNPGYGNFTQDTGRIDAVATVFPMFFLLVAMLVCLTTMTRLVEEKRTEIGTLKALGYSNMSIIFKFVSYSCLAAFLGCVLGCALGIPILPKVIYNAYGMLYNMRDINIVVSQSSLYQAIVSAFVCCAAVTFVVCYKTLRHKPATLMRPKTPKAGKRILLERISILWKHFNFSSKVTWRNLFRYKSRLFMTALGIAGCTALMLTAFGLYDSINDVVDLQFNELSNYNTIIVTDKEKSADDIAQLKSDIDTDERFLNSATVMQKNISVASDTAKKDSDVYLTVCENSAQFENILNLRDRKSQDKLSLSDSGVIITEKLSNLLGVDVKDTITIGEGDDTAKVIGIAENYVANYIYMSSTAYEKMTGDHAMYNTVYCDAQNVTKDLEKELGTDYLERDDVAAISFTSSISDDFKDMVSSMNMIVLVMIVCAGALAIVVLYNLTNINLAERNREISTIKVLGFNYKETASFVYRENIILTIFGIAVGLILGVWLWQFVVDTVEVDAIMFGKNIHVLSYFLAALLTGFFSLVVNFIMYFRIKSINMVESLKSIE